MKKVWMIILTLALLMSCFTACKLVEIAPEQESQSESESVSESEGEDEWALEKKELWIPLLVEMDKREVLPIEQLPGTELPYRVLASGPFGSSMGGAQFLTQEEAEIALGHVNVDANTVDFDTEVVIRIVTYGNMSEVADTVSIDVSDFCASIVNNKPNGRGGVFKAALFTIDFCFYSLSNCSC